MKSVLLGIAIAVAWQHSLIIGTGMWIAYIAWWIGEVG